MIRSDRRFAAFQLAAGLSLVPVTEGERIVGIVSLQNLMHSMNLLAEHRRVQRQSQE